jgi:hypothetical protein
LIRILQEEVLYAVESSGQCEREIILPTKLESKVIFSKVQTDRLYSSVDVPGDVLIGQLIDVELLTD